jgi:predicted transcriptional regulator
MPAQIHPDSHQYLVKLDPSLARRLEHFRARRAGGVPRIHLIRKAIEEYITAPAGRLPVEDDARRQLERFCTEGDGAVPEQVVSNALRMYIPQRRWELSGRREPETLSPALRHELRPAVAEQVQRFCSRTHVSSIWFLEQALQAQVARAEQDQWRRFLFSVPVHVAAAAQTNDAVVRSLEAYLDARLRNDPDLARRFAERTSEAAAQMPLFTQAREGHS